MIAPSAWMARTAHKIEPPAAVMKVDDGFEAMVSCVARRAVDETRCAEMIAGPMALNKLFIQHQVRHGFAGCPAVARPVTAWRFRLLDVVSSGHGRGPT